MRSPCIPGFAAASILASLGCTASLVVSLGCTASLVAPLGCASSVAAPHPPAGAPPTPTTVTRANPGGDADDPQSAALERLASEPWVVKPDRWKTLDVPLMDAKNWRRVKLLGQPTRVAFRYGDEHYAVVSIWYTPAEGSSDPEACLARFTSDATKLAQGFGVELGDSMLVETSQQVGAETRPVLVQLVDGRIESLLKSEDYVGAVAAYQSWPGTCLLQGFAVAARGHREKALLVRERWLEEGAAKLAWKVNKAPDPQAR